MKKTKKVDQVEQQEKDCWEPLTARDLLDFLHGDWPKTATEVDANIDFGKRYRQRMLDIRDGMESALVVDSKKVYEKHILTTELNGKTYKIKAKVSPDRITLTPISSGYDTFEFDRSTPDTVKAMAHLMIASCDLID